MEKIEIGDTVECTRKDHVVEGNIQYGERFTALSNEENGRSGIRYAEGFALDLKYCKLIEKARKPIEHTRKQITKDDLIKIENYNYELLALKNSAATRSVVEVQERFNEIKDIFRTNNLPFTLTWEEFSAMIPLYKSPNPIPKKPEETEEESYEEEEESSYEEEESSYEEDD